MNLAAQKLRQNVAEYIIFLWQMEDLVRAVDFDTIAVEEFIRSFTPDNEAFKEESVWFNKLMSGMKKEGVEMRGHITEVHELIFELNYLHNTMLNLVKDKIYLELYRKAQTNIQEYVGRTDGKITNDVEVCLTALYGMLVLRLKKEPISEETTDAMTTFSNLLSRLAHHYKLMKQGEVNFSLN